MSHQQCLAGLAELHMLQFVGTNCILAPYFASEIARVNVPPPYRLPQAER